MEYVQFDWLRTSDQFHLQNYLKVATGDFNGDRIDEIAVYVAERKKPHIEVYQYKKISGATQTAYQDVFHN